MNMITRVSDTQLREWLTAQEIANEALPELPNTKRGVNNYAAVNGWARIPSLCRSRLESGGGLEYNYRILPTLAQITYMQRYMIAGRIPVASATQNDIESTQLSDRAQLERDARLAVVAAFELFFKGLSLSVQGSMFIFCDRYNTGMIQVDPWVKEILPSIAQRSVFRWRSAKAKGKNDKLAVDRSTARKGTGLLDTANGGEVRNFILAWIAANPHLSAEIIRGYGGRFCPLNLVCL